MLKLHMSNLHARSCGTARDYISVAGDLDKEVPITFVPTALIQSIRFLIAVAAHYGIHLELNDIYTKTNRKFT